MRRNQKEKVSSPLPSYRKAAALLLLLLLGSATVAHAVGCCGKTRKAQYAKRQMSEATQRRQAQLPMMRQSQPSTKKGAGAALCDAIVDPLIAQDDTTARPALYRTVQKAVDAAHGTADKPYRIFVKAGTYNELVRITKPYVSIMGQDKCNTIITNGMSIRSGGVDKASTVYVTGHDVTLDNITMQNTLQRQGQALALYTKSDRVSLTNCNILGWQDTYRTGTSGQRHIVRNCKISGKTDYIYNSGDVYFDADTLEVLDSKNVITAGAHQKPKWGYVFSHAVITSPLPQASTQLGRPWKNNPKVIFLYTRLAPNVSIDKAGWRDMGALPTQLAEYDTRDAEGREVDPSERKTTFIAQGDTGTNVPVIDSTEASMYTIDNVLRGSDGWNADSVAFILPAPLIACKGSRVLWHDPTGLAACFLVSVDGKAWLTSATATRRKPGQTVSVRMVSKSFVAGDAAVCKGKDAGNAHAHVSRKVLSRTFADADGRPVEGLQHGLNTITEWLAGGIMRTHTVLVR